MGYATVMTHTQRYHLIVASASQTAMRMLMVAVGPGGAAELQSGGVRLSATGTLPATHVGVSGTVDSTMRGRFEAEAGAGRISSGIYWWRVSEPIEDEPSILLATNHPESATLIGRECGFRDCLRAMALQPITVELQEVRR
jgi:hypothetical protein